LSINLSAQTLKDIDFPDWLNACLQHHEVRADKICFELPETAVAANLGLAADLLRALQAMGCRLALDDFGGGLSSYGSLKNLPADILKIDGAFIRDMGRNTADRSVVKSVHDLAHLLGKLTVAKYVETDEAYRQARELGLDFAQGYHVERPYPLDELGLKRLAVPE
uniref:EAL domain-containing protein n=1 Tax=Aquisalimonas sp. TaxID=1872621 RepID=UPI0025BB8A29